MMNKPETSKSMASGRDFPMAQAFTVSACEWASHYSQHHVHIDVDVYMCIWLNLRSAFTVFDCVKWRGKNLLCVQWWHKLQ